MTLLVVRLYRAELLEPRAAVRARDVVCRARPARAVLVVTNHSYTAGQRGHKTLLVNKQTIKYSYLLTRESRACIADGCRRHDPLWQATLSRRKWAAAWSFRTSPHSPFQNFIAYNNVKSSHSMIFLMSFPRTVALVAVINTNQKDMISFF